MRPRVFRKMACRGTPEPLLSLAETRTKGRASWTLKEDIELVAMAHAVAAPGSCVSVTWVLVLRPCLDRIVVPVTNSQAVLLLAGSGLIYGDSECPYCGLVHPEPGPYGRRERLAGL